MIEVLKKICEIHKSVQIRDSDKYDIVTKGHGGHLEVETKEGMGTRFVVRLLST